MKKIEKVFRNLIGRPPYDYQEKIVKALLKGDSAFGVFPTGGGKSLCYQAPSLLKKGLVLVFSPLISLMKDQVDKNRRMGLRAARVTHDVRTSTIRKIYKRLGDYDLLYVAPERLKSSVFLDRMRNARRLVLIALDEFHEHNKSSRDFRPSYSLVKDFMESRADVPVVALTATADEDVEAEFKKTMGERGYLRIVASPNRQNLHYETTQEVSLTQLLDKLRPVQEEKASAIVYCSTRKICDNINLLLQRFEVNSGTYHGGMRACDRHDMQEAWMKGDVNTVVATNAFGMGVDKADVRVVFHWTQPGSVFQYVQEAGRAGRDGEDATCVLNLSADGLRTQQYFVDVQNPPMEVYENIWEYFEEKPRSMATVTTDRLAYICGLRNAMVGQVSAALCLLEYKGRISTTPCLTKYQLPVLNRELCAAYAGRFSFVNMANRICEVNVPPNEMDPVPEMIQAGAVAFQFPKKFIRIRRLKKKMGIARGEVAEKLLKARARLTQVREFANTQDKAAYLDKIFLKRQKEEVLV